jgi:hypothetical protein
LVAADDELTNYKSGIDVTWGGTKGVDYCEEYFYYDKKMDDHKVVYLRGDTDILMSHNERNNANYHVLDGGRQVIGENGRDNIPSSGDEGIIRYKIDRDRQVYYKWAANTALSDVLQRLPAYLLPFNLNSQFFELGVPVVGTTGSNGGDITSKSSYYFRGILDPFGDEWHVLSYADDDEAFLRLTQVTTGNFVDQAFYASDGKTVLLVVNPKTPCFTARATGTGQFYTTPPKAYFTPKILPQTTYISAGSSGTVTIELHDIYGNEVFYRINGGSFIGAGSDTATLSQNSFLDGLNTLEYYYKGQESHVKARAIVKNPPFPSASEKHGDFLWKDAAGLGATLARITREPFASTYKGYKTREDFSGQAEWDKFFGKGLRGAGGSGNSLKNAFVAKVEGWNFKRNGTTKTHGQYAKEMLLESSRTTDPVGFELQHSADAIPNRELHYRGYYDSLPILQSIFAYDIMIANFKSTQVDGGISPIEDYFIRDHFANFAYEAMQWSADMTGLGAPGMWGGARMMTAASIGMIMSEYSTPYYGTSGFGTVQTTYSLCPFQDDKLTWKAAIYDGTPTRSNYPNYKWGLGLSDNGVESLFTAEGQLVGTKTYPLGTWGDKAAYFQPGLMGTHLMVWANMSKIWQNRTDPRLEIAFQNASSGHFIGAKDPSPQTPARVPLLLLLNSRWKNVFKNEFSWIRSIPSSKADSDDKAMQDAGVFGFSWYEDDYNPNTDTGGDPDPNKLSLTVPSQVTTSVPWALISGTSQNAKKIQVKVNKKGYKKATGKDNWWFFATKLNQGDNLLLVRATAKKQNVYAVVNVRFEAE